MDEADIANEMMEQDLQIRLAEARAKMRTDGPEFCDAEDCGEPLPPARRKLGLRFCVDCAASRERRARLFRRD